MSDHTFLQLSCDDIAQSLQTIHSSISKLLTIVESDKLSKRKTSIQKQIADCLFFAATFTFV